ncbi:MAG: hypothetical protein EXR27_01235 [Betaproteobacteria bacterium]|nr:hypothetical protein [Betaproteobacteria bacterium]
MSNDLQAEIVDFVYRESELLDTGRYRDWLDLFHPEGTYWVPASIGQTDAHSHVSIFFEDIALLGMRIGRLEHPMAHGVAWPVRTSRIIGNLRVGEISAGEVEATSRFQLVEWQNERQRIFAGGLRHRLARVGETWKIREKRVDLVNAEGAFASIQFIF